MSGGVAYVFDEDNAFRDRMNPAMVNVGRVDDPEELDAIYQQIEKHISYTDSAHATRILAYWENYSKQFVRIIPKAYVKMRERINYLLDSGLDKFEAEMTAFKESKGNVAEKKNRKLEII